ncbi:MAG: EAL domain-containing protein, partial [Aeromonas sobria]
MAVRNQELNVALTTQLKQFNYDCGAKDMALLRGPRFYNTHIRLQGLELASGGGCSSLGPAVSLLSTAKQDGILFGKFGLTPTPAQFQTEQEMVAYYRAGNN